MASSSSSRKPVDSAEGNGAATGGPSTKDLLTAALQSRITSNNYIAHLKVWETVNEGPANTPQRKARYLILAVQRDTGKVTVNKAKRNANGTFSIGKDWDLNQLREVTVDQPDYFTLTLSRSYGWQTERTRDQTLFLQSLVKVFRKYTGDDSLRVVGLDGPASTNGIASSPEKGQSDGQRSREESRSVPRIDTAVTRERSRDSPVSSSAQRQTSNAQDGFYDPVRRNVNNNPVSPTREAQAQSIPTISTTLASEPTEPLFNVNSPLEASYTMSAPSPMVKSLSQENSLYPDRCETPPSPRTEKPIKLSRSPSRVAAKLAAAVERAATPTRNESDATPTLGTLSEDQPTRELPKPAPASLPPRRPPQARNRSSESFSSSLSVSGGARARLSSLEPTRGGAAYEKMLLAGTGLTGLAEGDEDDDAADDGDDDVDPYGGADFITPDILPRSKSLANRRKSRVEKKDLLHEEDDDNVLMHVEEMLEGFEFKQSAIGRGNFSGKGTADIIEARLLDELAALDAANIHAIIESDDRVNFVVQHMEEALHELDVIDSMIAGFKMQLNARADDINHIESQNRGLQVQTSNQRALSTEIEKLLSTVHVDDGAVAALLHAELTSDEDIGELEAAGAALYKAMLQARRTHEDSQHGDPSAAGLAAATERLDEYSAVADRFAKRLFESLSITFNEQANIIMHDKQRINALSPPSPVLTDHSIVEHVLGRYCGLLLYAKEVSPTYFSRISAAYFASASERYKAEMSKLFSVCKGQIVRVSDDEINETSFVPPAAPSSAAALRTGTIRRPMRDRTQKGSRMALGEITGSDAFARILTAITPIVTREQMFIADLLHINSNAITFADYMDLESYFRRRAAALYGAGQNPSGAAKSMKDALDLIFGFLAPEWQGLLEYIGRDKTQIIGVLAALDRGMLDAEEVNNEFLLRSLSKLQMRLASQLDKFIADQTRGIEQTKLTAKKRKGVVHFIKAFPIFVDRIEAQLVNAETLQIRAVVDHHYEQLCSTAFEALQSMAIPSAGGTFSTSNTDEDKGQLNHHVILIENMFHLVKGVTRIQTTRGTSALEAQLKRAQQILEDALTAYVQSILRRPLGKMVDFGDGIEGLMRNTPANEVSLHSAYSRQAAKRLVKEYSSKDLRKSVEALARRVQKHFDEDEITYSDGSHAHDASGVSAEEIVEVLSTVWRHVEDGFTHECERLVRILRECYSSNDGKLLAEFTMEDVRRPFASNSPAGRRR